MAPRPPRSARDPRPCALAILGLCLALASAVEARTEGAPSPGELARHGVYEVRPSGAENMDPRRLGEEPHALVIAAGSGRNAVVRETATGAECADGARRLARAYAKPVTCEPWARAMAGRGLTVPLPLVRP